MKRIISVLILVLAVMFLCSACAGNSGIATPDSVSTEDSTEKSAVNGKDSLLSVQTYEIKTPYCTLKYPAMWEDAVKITENNNKTVYSFTATVDGKTIKIFDLAFDSKDGIMLGSFKNEGEHTLSMRAETINEKDCTADQYRLFMGMQEDVNVIIANLKVDYEFKTK